MRFSSSDGHACFAQVLGHDAECPTLGDLKSRHYRQRYFPNSRFCLPPNRGNWEGKREALFMFTTRRTTLGWTRTRSRPRPRPTDSPWLWLAALDFDFAVSPPDCHLSSSIDYRQSFVGNPGHVFVAWVWSCHISLATLKCTFRSR